MTAEVRNRRFRISGFLFVCFLASACTSLARPDVQDVRIETTPPGATAQVRYGPECTTPCTVTLDRGNGYMVWLSKSGCKSKTVRIAPKARLDWYSVTVDHWTGDVYDLTPNPLAVDLSCRQIVETPPAADDGNRG